MIKTENYKRGAVIFTEGAQENWMFDILTGSVAIYSNYGKADQKTLAVLGEDEFFGEMGMIEHMPRSATAVCVENCHLRRITEESLDEYVNTKPAFVLTILQHTSKRLRSLSKSYVDVCDTLAEYVKAEEAGKEKSADLMEKMKKIADVSKKSKK